MYHTPEVRRFVRPSLRERRSLDVKLQPPNPHTARINPYEAKIIHRLPYCEVNGARIAPDSASEKRLI